MQTFTNFSVKVCIYLTKTNKKMNRINTTNKGQNLTVLTPKLRCDRINMFACVKTYGHK